MTTNLSKLAGSSLLFFTFISSFQAFGNPVNYYFSMALGDDSRTATQAQNPSTPWKTLGKLNSYFANLKPGDSVLFRRGEQYPGSITISASGTSSSPIVIGAYGSGAKPVITGFTTVSAWTSLGGGIWESASAISTLLVCNVVTINDTMKAMGRYPNDNAANKGYLTYQSHSGNNSITSNAISGAPSFVGKEVVVRLHRSYTDRCIVTGQTSTTVTFTTQSGSTPTNGFGFFFQNALSTLDKFGEWYYNPSTKKLDIFLGSSSSYIVKVSTIDTLVKASSKSYITFDNISFQGANSAAFAVTGGSGFTIQNCDIFYSGRDGIVINITSGFKVDGCVINYSNSRGFNGFQSNTTAPTIINNTVKNTGMFPGMGWKKAQDGDLVGIETTTNSSVIKNNIVINSGYHGIRIYGDNTVVKNNYVDSFCINKDDGGGIYTWNGSNATHNGIKIQNNVVLNGIGAIQGANSTNPEAQGIYLDDYANGIEVSGNTIANCRKAFFLHNGRNAVVSNNTFYNNEYGFRTQFDAGPGITGCKITRNILFARLSTQLCSYFTSTTANVANVGTFDSNYYCRPLFEPNGINTTSSSSGGISKVSTPSSTYYSLDAWRTAYGKDANSKKTFTTTNDVNKIRFEYNATNSAANVNLSPYSYIGVDGSSYSGTITLQPYTSLILINTGTAQLQSLTATEVASNISAETKKSEKEKLTVKAQPNPSAYYFNLLTQSNSNQPLIVRLIDLTGRILETKNGIDANGILQFGHNLKPGVYIIEVIQGKEKVQLKVIKI